MAKQPLKKFNLAPLSKVGQPNQQKIFKKNTDKKTSCSYKFSQKNE